LKETFSTAYFYNFEKEYYYERWSEKHGKGTDNDPPAACWSLVWFAPEPEHAGDVYLRNVG
jgi:hypothetical protein